MKQAVFAIFAILSIANATSSFKSVDDNILEITCLGKYTGVFHSFIFFAKNDSSTDYYCIRTPWLISYHSRIRTQLKNHNLTMFKSNPISKCGWTTLAHISMSGANTGSIYKKANTDNELNEIASEILSSIYPSIEMALTVIGAFLILAVFIYIRILCE